MPFTLCNPLAGFNTQPPEGGWFFPENTVPHPLRFNTQPPEGGWTYATASTGHSRVSTHSRPKAAGAAAAWTCVNNCSFNTQPPEGGWVSRFLSGKHEAVSTHSRPKAAGIT